MRNRIIFSAGAIFLFFVFACGDIFSKKTHIVGPYYLTDGETQGNFSIYFLTSNGNLIQKVPARVKEYGYFDSILVAKVVEKNDKELYYIINMSKDYDVAKEHLFRLGPIDSASFKQSFTTQPKIKWIQAE